MSNETTLDDVLEVASRIVNNAMPATASGHTCFVPRYQIDALRDALPALQSALEDARRYRDAPAVRVTGSGHSWEGGGKTTLIIDGDHHVELLRTYRIVPDPTP